jgi:hypothetical protein
MFTAQQYRTKAGEYEALLKVTQSPADTAEFRDLQQSYMSLADNLDWLANNASKTIGTPAANQPERAAPSDRHARHAEQENILRSLGAAVILKWNVIPTDLQRALFAAASSVQGAQSAPLKEVLAQFLHDHKDDAQRQQQRQQAG